MKCKVISIMNAKGGCGKTTVAVNLAHAVSKKDKNVLVIDLDPQANASMALLPENSNYNFSLYEYIDGAYKEDILSKCILPTHKNLWCLPNIIDSVALEEGLISANDFSAIFKLRPYIEKRFDFCFLDCPPTLGTWNLMALYGADYAVIPINAQDRFSIDGLLQTAKTIAGIRNKGSQISADISLVINKLHKGKRICKYNITQLENHFDNSQIFKTVIPDNVAFSDAVASHSTIFEERPNARGTNAFRHLSKEFLKIYGG